MEPLLLLRIAYTCQALDMINRASEEHVPLSCALDRRDIYAKAETNQSHYTTQTWVPSRQCMAQIL